MIGAVLSAVVLLGQAAGAAPPDAAAAPKMVRVCHSESSPDSLYPKQVCAMAPAPANPAPANPAPTPASAPTANASGVTVIGPKPLTAEQQKKIVVCHEEPVLGSHFPKKVCATQQALEDRQRDDQQVARDFQRSTIAGPQPM